MSSFVKLSVLSAVSNYTGHDFDTKKKTNELLSVVTADGVSVLIFCIQQIWHDFYTNVYQGA